MTTFLAIETSCDETAAAVVQNGRTILSNVVATQIELHRRYGGVFPEVASRQHVLSIHPVIEQALTEASVMDISTLDGIAVTHGPGLSGSLLVGVNAAKGIAFASGLPLLPINHLEGHVYSNWLESSGANPVLDGEFPLLVMIVSGGHTELILMTDHTQYERLGGTLDDAAGEAFDKVARLLDLGFPGGPVIQKNAALGDPNRFELPRPLLKNHDHRFNFSFSGLKTAVLNLVRQLEADGELGDDEPTDAGVKVDIAAAFQSAVVEVLVAKLIDAAQLHAVKRVCICGGVSANAQLRDVANARCEALGIPLTIPPLYLCTDNAAMIGAAAHFRCLADPTFAGNLGADVFANLPITTNGTS